jgi:3-hydroxymyristoyl/3-hydroxydecanoyl-(acyl carrier protein) dehydratase
MSLPHRFPFLFVSRTAEGKIEMSLSGGAWWSRAEAPPRTLGLEILAQAVLATVAGTAAGGIPEAPVSGMGEGSGPFLAALEDVHFHGDLSPAARLRAEFERQTGLGRLHRFRARLLADDAVAVEATLVVGL